jgi:mannose-6-phosphate isomerase
LGRQGKEECWLVLDADPDARLAIGFTQDIHEEAMRSVALDGTIENLLKWHPVTAGDFFYIPANTVHAIGAGITLVEVQQNSDITYRLYDYGRPRELHIEEGMAIALGAPYPTHLHKRVDVEGSFCLADGPCFRLDRLDGAPDTDTQARYAGPLLVVPLDCSVAVGGDLINPGQCALASNLNVVDFPSSGRCLIAQSI